MQRVYRTGLLTLGICCLLSACNAGKTDNSAQRSAGEALARNGKDAITACVACHGAQGEGNPEAGFPRLAGLDKGYITKQLQDFARDLPAAGVVIDPIARDYEKTPRVNSDLTVFTPGIRKDPMMSPLAKQLSPEQIGQLAAYYSSLPFNAKPVAGDFQTMERGADLALRGKPEYGLPACISCHAPDGEGFGAEFPPLAGQPVTYIVAQIDKWQRGERDNDPLGLMRAIAEQLTDADKLNVAAYYANRSLEVNTKK
jgi:cytochrome c553